MNSRYYQAFGLALLLSITALTGRAAAQSESSKEPAPSGSNVNNIVLTLLGDDGRRLVSRDGGQTWHAIEGLTMTGTSGGDLFGRGASKTTVYPNPAISYASISYTVQQSGEVTLSLFDVGGGEVKRLSAGAQPVGVHTTSVDVSGMRDGTYYYRITVGGTTAGGGMMAVVH